MRRDGAMRKGGRVLMDSAGWFRYSALTDRASPPEPP